MEIMFGINASRLQSRRQLTSVCQLQGYDPSPGGGDIQKKKTYQRLEVQMRLEPFTVIGVMVEVVASLPCRLPLRFLVLFMMKPAYKWPKQCMTRCLGLFLLSPFSRSHFSSINSS